MPDIGDPPASVPAGAVVVRWTSVIVEFAGVVLDRVLAVHCSFGWDQPVSDAQITLTRMPTTGSYHDPVTVTVNGVLRFSGILTAKDFSNWPRTVVLQAKGELVRAEEYVNQSGDLNAFMPDPGTTLDVLLGGPSSGTLRQIVAAVLTVCSVPFDLANFADPPHIYGLVAPEEFTWKYGTSGLAYLHTLFEATAGYRLFHSGDGNLYLAQIIGRPRAGAADLVLTQGVDILDGAHLQRSIDKLCNVVIVTGYDDGSGLGPLQQLVSEGTDFPPDRTYPVTSSLIEDEAFALDLATNYWLPTVNRELVTGSVPTWRDDVMGPAQSHTVDALDRLGTGEKLWVTGLVLETNDKGELTQTPTYVGGGVEADYSPVPV